MIDLEHLTDPAVTYLSNAIHFRRGIHLLLVDDMEVRVLAFIRWRLIQQVEIGIPSLPGKPDEPDLDFVRLIWWLGLNAAKAAEKKEGKKHFWEDKYYPICVYEMRLMKSSEVTMAPQKGNYKWICSIEFLTMSGHNREQYMSFCQDVVNQWLELLAQKNAELKSRGDVLFLMLLACCLLIFQPTVLQLKPHWAKVCFCNPSSPF